MVPATPSRAWATKSTPSAVVMCSITIFSLGRASTKGFRTFSTHKASRSKMSASGFVVSPWHNSGIPTSAMVSSVGYTSAMSVSFTPASEFVVAPAGYHLTALTMPEAAASRISAGVVVPVKYNVIKGSKRLLAGRAATIRSRYALAMAKVLTGGTRFGIMMALWMYFAEWGSTALSMSPSRTWRWKSSGAVITTLSIIREKK
mmetsp:Transcript_29723/g.53371  ORF Transcript_29723/g.53371 Transcript_29723/m.53371 type:complete len:203 (-) Transcript_29723:23-631(-)